MSIDIADLFKYGWMLLLTIIPRHITSMNAKFKALEERDTHLKEDIAALREENAVLCTKVEQIEDSLTKLEDNIASLVAVVTELRIELGKR